MTKFSHPDKIEASILLQFVFFGITIHSCIVDALNTSIIHYDPITTSLTEIADEIHFVDVE